MSLNETPHENFLRTPLLGRMTSVRSGQTIFYFSAITFTHFHKNTVCAQRNTHLILILRTMLYLTVYLDPGYVKCNQGLKTSKAKKHQYIAKH